MEPSAGEVFCVSWPLWGGTGCSGRAVWHGVFPRYRRNIMYKTGEKIIYGSTGVCTVEGVTTLDGQGEDERLYYALNPMYQAGMIYTPVDSKVFMRPIITRAQALALIDAIPDTQVPIYHSSITRELEEHYNTYLKSHDCAALLEMTRSIHAKRQLAAKRNRKFGAVDERYMKRAEDLLYGELAVVLRVEKNQVPAYINRRLKAEIF